VEAIEKRLGTNSKFSSIQDLNERKKRYEAKMKLDEEIKELKRQLKNREGHIMQDELKSMKRVLRR